MGQRARFDVCVRRLNLVDLCLRWAELLFATCREASSLTGENVTQPFYTVAKAM